MKRCRGFSDLSFVQDTSSHDSSNSTISNMLVNDIDLALPEIPRTYAPVLKFQRRDSLSCRCAFDGTFQGTFLLVPCSQTCSSVITQQKEVILSLSFENLWLGQQQQSVAYKLSNNSTTFQTLTTTHNHSQPSEQRGTKLDLV